MSNATFDPLNQCLSLNNDCLNVVKPLSSLLYCCNSSCTYNFSENPDQCTCPWTVPGLTAMYNCIYDDVYAVGNTRNPERLFLASFRKHTHQVYNTACANSTVCRKPWLKVKTQQLYVAGVEDYIVRMDHTLIQDYLNIERSANSMNGALWVDGTSPLHAALCANPPRGYAYKIHPDISMETTSSAPCMIPPDYSFAGTGGMQPAGQNLDVYHVSTLLAAAGHDLDSSSARVNGVSLTINIVYGNIYGQSAPTGSWPQFGRKDPFYYYRVRGAFDSGYQELTVDYVNETYRMLESPFGISFNIQAAGQFGDFDFLTASQVVVTGLALTGMSSVIVTFVAMYVARRRHYYQILMKAPAFNIDLDENDRLFRGMSNKKLREELFKRGLPITGDRRARRLRLHEAVHHEFFERFAVLEDRCKDCKSKMIEIEKGNRAVKYCTRHSCELPAPDRMCPAGCEYFCHFRCSQVCSNDTCENEGQLLTKEHLIHPECIKCKKKVEGKAHTCEVCERSVCDWCWKVCPCHLDDLVLTDHNTPGQCHECHQLRRLRYRCRRGKRYAVCDACGPPSVRAPDESQKGRGDMLEISVESGEDDEPSLVREYMENLTRAFVSPRARREAADLPTSRSAAADGQAPGLCPASTDLEELQQPEARLQRSPSSLQQLQEEDPDAAVEARPDRQGTSSI